MEIDWKVLAENGMIEIVDGQESFIDGIEPYNVTEDQKFDGWRTGQETYKSANKVVGYWDFDNVVGDMVIDKSGNDNHAKIYDW